MVPCKHKADPYQSGIDPVLDQSRESGSETVHKKDISKNSFFCSVGKDLAEKIDPAPNPLLAGDYEINKHKATFHFRTN